MNIIARIDHALFGHSTSRNPAVGEHDRERELPEREVPGMLENIVALENGYSCRKSFCDHVEHDLVEYKGKCKCGELLRADSLLELEIELDDHLGDVNHEKCLICGKVFTGEHAAQKKGGHKASAHYN